MDTDGRKELILKQAGLEAVRVLEDAGIDVDEVVMILLQEQAQKQARLETLAYSGQVSDIMTSELVYKSASPEDIYGQEFTRRLKSIGATDEQVASLYQLESLILSVDGLRQQRDEPWARRRFFINDETTPDNLPKKGLLTLSELILITDEANYAYSGEHEVLSEQTWGAVCTAALAGGAQYAFGLRERLQRLGLSQKQEEEFGRNECMLTARLKWGYHKRPAWTDETARLA